MTGEPGAALRCLRYAATRDEAQHFAQIAARRGATPAELADAWADFDELQPAIPAGVVR